MLGHRCRAVLSLRNAFADGKTADCETIERQLSDGLCTFDAQVGVAGTLHDAEQRLWRFATRGQTAHRPTMREFHRLPRHAALDRRGHTLIEHHHDVGADRLLCRDAALGAQRHDRVVDVASELGALLSHIATVRQRENLKPAGIRQHGAWPIHEAVNAAELLEYLDARSQQ
jgi:hypothetical protein